MEKPIAPTIPSHRPSDHQVLHQPSMPHHGSQQRPLAFHPGAAAFVAARGAGAGRCRGQYRGSTGRGWSSSGAGMDFWMDVSLYVFLMFCFFHGRVEGVVGLGLFFGILLDFWDFHSEIWPLCGWEFEILPGILWGIVGDLVYDGNKGVQSPCEPRNHHEVIGHCGVSMRKSWRVVKICQEYPKLMNSPSC